MEPANRNPKSERAMKTTTDRARALVCALMLVGALGCDSNKADTASTSEPAATEEPASETPAKDEGASKTPAKPASGKAEVTKEGSKFDPPIAKAEVPEGAYYCDMGTVHYARMEEGDGKCPLCGMALVHEQPGAEDGGDHAGHGDHGAH
jgi:glucose/arabinose dehydrogenase